MVGKWSLVLIAGWVIHHSSQVESKLENLTLAVVLPETNMVYPWALPRVGPAIRLAVDRINNDSNLLPDVQLRALFGNSEDRQGKCSEASAPLVAVDFQFNYHPEVFVGPGCMYTAAPVGRFTGHWKVPLITAGAPAYGFGKKVEGYEFTTRTGPIHTKLGEFVVHIHRQYNWSRRAMLLYSDDKEDDRPCYFTMEGPFMELRKIHNMTVVDMNVKETELINYTAIIQDIKQKGRIVYTCCSPDIFRELMLHAQRHGLCSGEYVFFYIDIYGASLQGSSFPDYQRPWQRGDINDDTAKEAFMAVMIITYKEPETPDYKRFLEDLRHYTPNLTLESTLMNTVAAAFYDSIMLYALAINETRTLGYSMKNASAVTYHMWNRAFNGVSGFMKIDDNGDRENDYSLWDLSEHGGNFQIVANYNGTLKTLIKVPEREIHWPGKGVPSDVPDCGFDGNNPECMKTSFSVLEITSIVICFILLAIAISSIFIYRKLRLEKELAAELWKVRWEDIQTSNMEKILRRAGSKLTLSLVTPPDPHEPCWPICQPGPSMEYHGQKP